MWAASSSPSFLMWSRAWVRAFIDHEFHKTHQTPLILKFANIYEIKVSSELQQASPSAHSRSNTSLTHHSPPNVFIMTGEENLFWICSPFWSFCETSSCHVPEQKNQFVRFLRAFLQSNRFGCFLFISPSARMRHESIAKWLSNSRRSRSHSPWAHSDNHSLIARWDTLI